MQPSGILSILSSTCSSYGIGNMSVPISTSSPDGPSAPDRDSRASLLAVMRESCSIGFQKALFIITYLIAILEKLWL